MRRLLALLSLVALSAHAQLSSYHASPAVTASQVATYAPVKSVAGRTGAVVLAASDVSGLASAASAAAPVQSVAGRTGSVVISASDVSGLSAAIPVTSVNGKTGAVVITLAGTTGSIGGTALLLGGCSTGTATVTGASASMGVIASPTVNPGAGVIWLAYISAANTVTVKVCGILALTPVATTYNIRVFP